MKTHSALLGLVLLVGALSLIAYSQTTGGRFDLIQEIEKASPGAEIRIPAGEFRTSRQIRIRKPITLRGAGEDKTRLVFTGPGEKTLEDFITIEVGQSRQPVVIEDISFTYRGYSPGNLVVVSSGTAEFHRCSFKGAGYTEEAGGGSAIFLSNNSRGTVKECDFSENRVGVEVSGTAIVVIEDSRFMSNQTGIVFFENSGGRVLNNTCKNNGGHALQVSDDAKPTLVGNTCEGNKGSGIAYSERARGEARNNTCKNNELSGISVLGDAKPTLVGNTCEGNKGGIGYSDRAGGEARNNICKNNDLNGISVLGDAKPTLVGNTCEGNQGSGIVYLDRAGGEARNNICRGNWWGIALADSSNPRLIDNIVLDNSQRDIADFR